MVNCPVDTAYLEIQLVGTLQIKKWIKVSLTIVI